jgi:hypothetical protein
MMHWATPIALLAMQASGQQSVNSIAPIESSYLVRELENPAILATLREFAQCVAKRDQERTRAFLESGLFAIPNNPQVRALAMANQRCLVRGTLTFNQVYFAGAAAEALYSKSRFKFADFPPAFPSTGPTTIRSRSAHAGLCVAARQPGQVDRLLRSPAGGPGEMRILLNLRPSVEMCMPDVNKAPQMIRAVIAAGAFPFVASLIKADR